MVTRIISQAELRNGSAAVMDALEAGEDFVVTRNGKAVGELKPVRRTRDLTAEELVALFSDLPAGDRAAMRAEADTFFSENDRW